MCSLVKTELRRATRYFNGEASILGIETGESARGSSGVSGATCRDRGRANWGDPSEPLTEEVREETSGIRQSRSPGEFGRESDGAIVLMTLETT
jgi:hypothetical protein